MDALVWLVIILGGLVAMIVVLLAVTLRRPLLATTPAPPEAVLRDVAFRLRSSGRLVKEARGHVEVSVNSLARLKIHARPTPRGTEVRYEVDATGTGWVLVLILGGFGGFGLIAIAIALYIHFTASEFARVYIWPLLVAAPLGTPPPATVRSLLLEGMSEAARLSSEAAEYEREAMHNWIGGALIASVFLFGVILFGVFAIGGLPFIEMLVALVAPLVLAVAGPLVIYRRTAPRVRELESEASLYAAALAVESVGFPVPGGPRPGLELLLRAAERSPRWREIRRRRKMWHDPLAGFVIFLLGYAAFLFLVIAASLDILPLLMRGLLAVLGVGCAAGAAWMARRWIKQVREEDERDRRAWESRRASLEAELWRILAG